MSTTRSDHLTVGYSPQSATHTRSTSPSASPSPNDASTGQAIRSPFGMSGGLNPGGNMAGATRSGTGSPSHEMAGSGRLFSKRAREIQAQEGIPGLPLNPWGGPPTSGNSTPLRENIPESPTDGFPEIPQLPTPDSLPQPRRARAGTVPSKFTPGGIGNIGGIGGIGTMGNGYLNVPGLAPLSSRVSPSHSPFKSPSPGLEPPESTSPGSALLSRLRAGSMPQRSPFAPLPGSNSPFGPGFFGGNWNPGGTTRERGATLASIASLGSNGPSSPAQSAFSRDGAGETDVHMRTLDYLGLAETPQPPRAQLAPPYMANMSDFAKASRFRSYSVNNKDKYDDEDDEDYDDGLAYEQYAVAAQLENQLAATNAAIHNHNLAVQAFATQTSFTRPRARTAGVLDLTGGRMANAFFAANQGILNPVPPAEIRLPEEKEFDDLPQAVAAMSIGRSSSQNGGLLNADEQGLEGPTSALWLGSIPTSTTTSTLTEMFKSYGPILSARVLTHKNCGFVNFERVESAISARSGLNGKEIFPGAGPIRINFAKPPSASNTPGHDGIFPSPSPDPFTKGQENVGNGTATVAAMAEASVTTSQQQNGAPVVPPLRDMLGDILDIVKQFGASDEDRYRITRNLQSAIQYDSFMEEIPTIREPSHTRIHDAPKLRDIRKKIDNQTLSRAEIESIAVEMLPEIAELSSDYLGNTVVQKLFEHCSDELRDAMLAEIAPHMAEIGVHKNGTWAAQKIIDVCKTPQQMMLIVEHLRPYTIPLFLDQYGNYVLQGCLKFGAPYNDFIFESMLSQMWEIAQGRYGARAMRACLESHHSTKDQQRLLAAAIALHSVQLATNANGALLLTWFLDTCTFPQRRTVLSPQLVPYLVHLCTHKVAYLTVLKVINQKAEGDARDTIMKALFFTPNDQVLEAILSDHACGATLIFKVLTTPFFDDSIRSQVVENVKNVLVRIKAQPSQGYKRLMDEVGLSSRNASSGPGNREHGAVNNNPGEQRQRPASRQANHQQGGGHMNKPQQQQQGQPQPQPQSQQQQQQQQQSFYNASMNNSNFELGYGGQRNEPSQSDLPSFPPFGSQQQAMYGQSTTPIPAQPLNFPHLPFQQPMTSRAGVPFFPPMQAGMANFPSSQSIEQYRQQNMPNGSPIQPTPAHLPPMGPNQPPFGPPGFGMGMGMGGFNGYGNLGGGMQNMAYMQQEQVNARRGRR